MQYIVHPSWITDSISSGKRLPERGYSLMSQISKGLSLQAGGSSWAPTRPSTVVNSPRKVSKSRDAVPFWSRL